MGTKSINCMETSIPSSNAAEQHEAFGGPVAECIYVACVSLLPEALVTVAACKGLTYILVQRELDQDAVLVRVAADVPLLTQPGRAFTCLLSHTALSQQALLYDRRLSGLALADVQELLTEQAESLRTAVVSAEREAVPTGEQISMHPAAPSQEQHMTEQQLKASPTADTASYLVGPTIVLPAARLRQLWSKRHRLPSARQLPRLLLRTVLATLVDRRDRKLVRRLLAWRGPGTPQIQVQALSAAGRGTGQLWQIRVYVPVACAA